MLSITLKLQLKKTVLSLFFFILSSYTLLAQTSRAVTWKNFRGTRIDHFGWLKKSWDFRKSADAISKQIIKKGEVAYISMYVRRGCESVTIGLNDKNQSTASSDIAYAWYFKSGNAIYIQENGEHRGDGEPSMPESKDYLFDMDLYQISTDSSGYVDYYKNGVHIWHSDKKVTSDLFVDVSITSIITAIDITITKGKIPCKRVKNATPWVKLCRHIYYNNGFVGIGTTNPQVPLDVHAQIDSVGGFNLGDRNLNRGTYSTTIGGALQSTALYSFALGDSSSAVSPFSFAKGRKVKVKGYNASALGQDLNADSRNVFVTGIYNVGGGSSDSLKMTDPLFELGNGTSEQNRNNALTILKNGFVGLNQHQPLVPLDVLVDKDSIGGFNMGRSNTNTGTLSMSVGSKLTSSAPYSVALGDSAKATAPFAFAKGQYVNASGKNASALGTNLKANSKNVFVSGMYNIGGGSSDSLKMTDPLFELGNGTSEQNRNNALTILKNGFVGLNQYQPLVPLDVLVDKDSIGGLNLGRDNSNSGSFSVTIGKKSHAIESHTVAIGDSAQAFAPYSFAQGNNVRVMGNNGVAFGEGLHADSKNVFVIGSYNIGGGAKDSLKVDDPLFEIGNGISNSKRSNALTILKNGSIGINEHHPTIPLDIRTQDGTKGGFNLGDKNINEGRNSVSIGRKLTANALHTFVLGDSSLATNPFAVAIGKQVQSESTHGTAIGQGVKAQSINVFAIGRYNVGGGIANFWNENDPLLEVGNGQSATQRSNAMTILKNGNVGIGFDKPSKKLEVNGDGRLNGDIYAVGEATFNDGAVKFGDETSKITGDLELDEGSLNLTKGNIKADTLNIKKLYLNGKDIFGSGNNSGGSGSNGSSIGALWYKKSGAAIYDDKVGIGVDNPTLKLEVNGKIRTREVRVEGKSTWPDYVFKNDYKLRDLNQLEAYISKNKHLPNVPSEKEVKKEGFELGEMNAKLLEKIEELTLYIIQQNKRIEELEKKVFKK